MELIFRIPGKTFLLGEYAVLNSAPAIIFCHEPYFEFSVRDQASAGFVKWRDFFHPESPAGVLSEKFDLNNQKLFIKCEHQYGHGGFGLSTAEFLVAYHICQMKIKSNEDCKGSIEQHLPLEVDHHQLLSAYWQVFDTLQKKRPSGADLQAQSHGRFSYVDQKNGILQSYPWLFADLSVLVVPTGNKLKTHEHLSQLQDLDFSRLIVLSNSIVEVFGRADSRGLVQLVNAYGAELENLNLLAPYSKQLLTDLRKIPGVMASKGCGAMGADSLLLLVASEKKNEIQNTLRSRDLRFFDSVGNAGSIL